MILNNDGTAQVVAENMDSSNCSSVSVGITKKGSNSNSIKKSSKRKLAAMAAESGQIPSTIIESAQQQPVEAMTAAATTTTTTAVTATKPKSDPFANIPSVPAHNNYQQYVDEALKDNKDSQESNSKNLRKRFIHFAVLFHSYRKRAIATVNAANASATAANGEVLSNGNKDNNNSEDNESSLEDETAAASATTLKISRNDQIIRERNKAIRNFIPDEILRYTNLPALMAAAVILLSEYKRDYAIKMMHWILYDDNCPISNIAQVVDFAAKPITTIHTRLAKIEEHKTHDSFIALTVSLLLKLADIFRERHYSAILMDFNYDIYLKMTSNMVRADAENPTNVHRYKTIYPYDALIKRYMKKCVAPYMQYSHNREINAQFNINPVQIMSKVLNDLCKMSQMVRKKRGASGNNGSGNNDDVKAAKRSRRSANGTSDETGSGTSSTGRRGRQRQQFDSSITYETFRGPVNFHLKIIPRYLEHEGDIYEIREYRDCLFDVISSKNRGSFNMLSWSERLRLLDHKTRVMLVPMTGEALNQFVPETNCLLGISWQNEDKQSFFRTVAFSAAKGAAAAAAAAAAANGTTNGQSSAAKTIQQKKSDGRTKRPAKVAAVASNGLASTHIPLPLTPRGDYSSDNEEDMVGVKTTTNRFSYMEED